MADSGLGRSSARAVSDPCATGQCHRSEEMGEAVTRMYRDDPYAAMSDEEFDTEVLSVLDRTKTRAVSLRLPLELIERAKAVAEAEHIPYQTLMKAFIDGGVRRFERRRATGAGSRRRVKA
jgi:predicted DNA binding CopG/RHH family protein